MAVVDQLRGDLNEALKARDEVKVSTLRFLISKLDNAKIAKGAELSDTEAISEIFKDAKGHKESIAAFEKASRSELAQKEKAELEILAKYLPEELTEVEINKLVEEAIVETGASKLADMGKVMAVVSGKVKSRADGATVSQIVKTRLGRE